MKLSIITINRNNADGLRKTMQSVLSQTYRDFEYIVVDGASIDGSVEVIKGFEKELSAQLPFHWISEPDSGVYQAMNKGIALSNGDYLLFLNSGDFLIGEDVIDRVFSYDIGADVVTARCHVSDCGKVVWTSPFLKEITLFTLYTVGIPHQSTFINRSLFGRFGLYREDYRYNSDIAFWYKAILFGGATTQGVDVITTDYDKNGISGTQSTSEAYLKEMKEIHSQGILPLVLPDYDKWKKERQLFQKYVWIEKHPVLQIILSFYYRVCKHI